MIDLALIHVTDFERWLKTMQQQVDSKQSTRIFSNNVWLRDHLEAEVRQHLEPAKYYLQDVQHNAQDSTVATNATMSIKHCNDLITLCNNLISIHKTNPSDMLARTQWAQALPKLFATITHLRNRLTISSNLLKNVREREKDNWLNEL